MLRQNISVVLQDSVLFEGSIRENLEIGRPGASLEELIDACIKANIHETIANLPDGYGTTSTLIMLDEYVQYHLEFHPCSANNFYSFQQ